MFIFTFTLAALDILFGLIAWGAILIVGTLILSFIVNLIISWIEELKR